jgi:hypothetical protein
MLSKVDFFGHQKQGDSTTWLDFQMQVICVAELASDGLPLPSQFPGWVSLK